LSWEWGSRKGGSAEVQQGRVDELLITMGLEICQHTYVGNEFLKGLSGGQRRRLSLAVALCTWKACAFWRKLPGGNATRR